MKNLSVDIEKVASVLASIYYYNRGGSKYDGAEQAIGAIFGEEAYEAIVNRSVEIYNEKYANK